MSKWFVGTDTTDTSSPTFKTKREAIEYGRKNLVVFIVWKGKTK